MVEPSKVDKIPAVKGSYFLPRRARRRPALLRFAGKHMQLVTPTGERMRFDLADTRVSTPLAKLNFTFHFIDGSLFECPSNVAVHNWLVTQSGHSVQSVAHRLESKWLWMGGLSLAGISLVLLLFFKGVPLFTSWAANQLPTSISKQIGETTFDVFDEYYLEESLLSQARQTEIRQIFQQFVAFHPVGSFTHTPKLYFRQGGEFIGANAFAIPDGTVLVTDELVGFVPNDDALAGIMAHELGHLRYKHGMQSVISTTLVPVFLTLVAGDLLNAASMASTLGILLIDNGYSRDFEREADRHAKSLFSWIGLSTQPVADFFQLMILEREKDQEDDGPNRGIALMSTHPSDIERVQFFQDTVTP